MEECGEEEKETVKGCYNRVAFRNVYCSAGSKQCLLVLSLQIGWQ